MIKILSLIESTKEGFNSSDLSLLGFFEELAAQPAREDSIRSQTEGPTKDPTGDQEQKSKQGLGPEIPTRILQQAPEIEISAFALGEKPEAWGGAGFELPSALRYYFFHPELKPFCHPRARSLALKLCAEKLRPDLIVSSDGGCGAEFLPHLAGLLKSPFLTGESIEIQFQKTKQGTEDIQAKDIQQRIPQLEIKIEKSLYSGRFKAFFSLKAKTQIESQAGEKIGDQAENLTKEQSKEQTENQTGDQTGDQTEEKIKPQIENHLSEDQIRSKKPVLFLNRPHQLSGLWKRAKEGWLKEKTEEGAKNPTGNQTKAQTKYRTGEGEKTGQASPPPPKALEFNLPKNPIRRVGFRATESQSTDLKGAKIIISGGRGMQNRENFQLLEELAELVGGAVGASRAVTDAGWQDHSRQVGQTGKTVAPKLYIACGISGAAQHLAGIQKSHQIVVINKDPSAPFFKNCSYGLIGDLFEIIPLLIKNLKEEKE